MRERTSEAIARAARCLGHRVCGGEAAAGAQRASLPLVVHVVTRDSCRVVCHDLCLFRKMKGPNSELGFLYGLFTDVRSGTAENFLESRTSPSEGTGGHMSQLFALNMAAFCNRK